MASLTVRQLDDKLKKRLRLRAAKNGRSVEDEVRTILRSAAADARRVRAGRRRAAAEPGAHRPQTARQAHPAHHRRRHRRLQIARPDPPAARARRRACAWS